MAKDNETTGGVQPQTIYPDASKGRLTGGPTTDSANSQVQDATQTLPNKYNSWSIGLLILLLLTFFTPLGSALFLPIVLIGLTGAVWHAQSAAKPSSQQVNTPKSFIFIFFKVVMIISTVIVLGIVSIIGLFFLLIGTGAVDFNMGS